jgi:uncharacterized protein (DUF1697 family)
MDTFAVLLRGINVGGKNKIRMTELKTCLEGLGFLDVSTYIASGNVILKSNEPATGIEAKIETALPAHFTLDDEIVRVLALTSAQLQGIVHRKPEGFGEQPDLYHSDVFFLIGITAAETMPLFSPRDGVDRVWPGEGVIYSQRLSAELSKSRLNKIVGTPAYKSMTGRSWSTTTRLLEIVEKARDD